MNESNHPLFDPANLTDQEVARLRNLAGLKELGIDPYPARVRRSHTIAQARALHESGASADAPVTVTGRIKRLRIMGKMSFADLEDGTGSIQIVARKDGLPDSFYDEVWKKLVDLGDFVGATGPLFVTKTGELSVEVRAIQFLSKALQAHARQMARRARPGDALSAALRRPAGEPAGARRLSHPRGHRARAAHLSGCGGLPGGRDADPAADLRWCGGAALRDPPQPAPPGSLPADQLRALPEAAAGGRLRQESTRLAATSATRASASSTIPSSRSSSSTRPMRTIRT